MKKTVIGLILTAILFSGCSFEKKNSSVKTLKTDFIPPQAAIILDRSVKELRLGEVGYAIKDLKELTVLYPSLSIGYYNLGLAYVKNNQTEEAIKAWEQTVKIDNRYADAYFNLGRAYKNINRIKAKNSLMQYVLLRPDDPYINAIKEEISKLREPVVGDGIIGRVSVTDEVDTKNNIALSVKDFFSPVTPVIYTCIELVNASKDKNIQVNWYYIMKSDEKMLVNSTRFAESGSKNVVISLKKPHALWPSGRYEEEILVNGIENVRTSFIIQR